MSLTQDTAAQKVVESREALFGRVSSRLGPVPSFVSTHPMRGITPKRVAAIHSEVLIAGWMLNKACLDEDLLLADSHLRSQDSSFRDSIVGAPWSIEPADDSELARQVADYQTAVFRNCYGFKKRVVGSSTETWPVMPLRKPCTRTERRGFDLVIVMSPSNVRRQ